MEQLECHIVSQSFLIGVAEGRSILDQNTTTCTINIKSKRAMEME